MIRLHAYFTKFLFSSEGESHYYSKIQTADKFIYVNQMSRFQFSMKHFFPA